MSYDLYFFKRKESQINENDIANYLSLNLVEEDNNQWFFQNPDTEVYFIFERTEIVGDDEDQMIENFKEFDNLNFAFILNFLRPSFFGIEAFQFIEKIVKDLDLYIFNPQSDKADPYKPSQEELYENWNTTNLNASSEHFSDQCSYLEIEKSNSIWNYNLHRSQIQNKLGNDYFVPKMFFFKTKEDNKIITVSSWTEHIPNLIPPADYYLLTKVQKKLFRTKQENVFISRENLISIFGDYFDEYNFVNCKIINPENARKIKSIFNSTTSEIKLENFAERIQIENLFNAKPSVTTEL